MLWPASEALVFMGQSCTARGWPFYSLHLLLPDHTVGNGLSSLPQRSRACFQVLCGLRPQIPPPEERLKDHGQRACQGLTRGARHGGIRWNLGLWCLRGCAGGPFQVRDGAGGGLGFGAPWPSVSVPPCSIVRPRYQRILNSKPGLSVCLKVSFKIGE